LLLPAVGQTRSARFEQDMLRFLSPDHEYRVVGRALRTVAIASV
jgi:hypothetical protein